MRSGEPARRAVRRRWLCALAASLLVALDDVSVAQPLDRAESAASSPLAPPAAVPPSLAEQVAALRLEVSELRAAVQAASLAETTPPWAEKLHAQLDRRLERLAVMQERLAARIETPTPRLTEPIVLFTVAGCMLVFGFIVGRGAQRRSSRRDSRLRL